MANNGFVQRMVGNTNLWLQPHLCDDIGLVAQVDDGMQAFYEESRGWSGGFSGGLPGDLATASRTPDETLDAMYGFKGMARRVIDLYVMYCIGDGVTVTFESKAWQDAWDAWAWQNRFGAKLRNAVMRQYLYGVYAWMLPNRERDWKRNKLRYLYPYGLKVELDDYDPEQVVSVSAPLKTGAMQDYDPENVFFWAHDKPDGAWRGWSALQPVIVPLAKYEIAVNNWDAVLDIRSRVPIIRQRQQSTTGSGGSAFGTAALPPRRSILNVPLDDVWTFPKLEAGSSDAKELCREWLVGIGAGTNIPEYMLSGDANHKTLAGTAMAESPMIKFARARQVAVEEQIERAIDWIIGREDIDFTVNLPDLNIRDAPEQMTADIAAVNGRYISVQTFHERVGLDPTEERQRLDEERSLDAGYSPTPTQRPNNPPVNSNIPPEEEE